MSQRVVILGTGEIGSALTALCRQNQVEPELWSRTPGKVPQQKPLDTLAAAADVLFLAIPSQGVRALMNEINPFLRSHAVVVALAKGMEPQSHATMAEVMQQLSLPVQPWGLLHGPMLAEEILTSKGGVGVVAAQQKHVYDTLQPLLSNPGMWLEYDADVMGASWLGVLKNVYALWLGMAEALGWGSNMRGWLMARSVQEIDQILARVGQAQTRASCVVGLGDYAATGLSTCSKNHEVGIELVKGNRTLQSEGIQTLPSLLARLDHKLDNLPLLNALSEIVLAEQSVNTAIQRLNTQIFSV